LGASGITLPGPFAGPSKAILSSDRWVPNLRDSALAENLRPVMVDPDQIRLILNNLFANAIQAMPEGGALIVQTRPLEDTLEVTVADTGSGIAPDHLERIFEPLFTTKSKGIGLGLSLARRLAEANGGSIRVESLLGQGSRFMVELGRETDP
jgi:signal transduction histidine kinase